MGAGSKVIPSTVVSVTSQPSTVGHGFVGLSPVTRSTAPIIVAHGHVNIIHNMYLIYHIAEEHEKEQQSDSFDAEVV